MQLSENTITVLKNFSGINTGLFVRQGNILRTVNRGKSVLAEATIDESMPKDFGINELPQLLAIISLSKTPPELHINGNDVVIQGFGGRSKISYRTCDATMVKTPPDKNLKVPTVDLKFTLTEEDYAWIMKSASVLGSPNITVFSRDGKLYLGTLDSSDNAAHADSLEIGTHTGDPVFFMFKTENWVMLSGTYDVIISTQGIAHFQNTARKIQYWVALEAKKP